jgi:hypothetical protein
MGHTWYILVPSCLTLPKKVSKYQSTGLFHRIGHFSMMHLTLFYSLEQLKDFENAGCALYYGCHRSEWSSLYEEIEQFKNSVSRGPSSVIYQTSIGPIEVMYV